MKRRARLLVLASALLACSVAQAIPPPWFIEELKAKADVILIARTTKGEDVRNVAGINRKIGLKPVELLKGKIARKEGEEPKLALLYYRRPKVLDAFRPMPVGGTGHPKPADDELALVFLKRDKRRGEFRAVCGSFGYVSLDASTPEKLAAVKKSIEGYRRWCARIKNAALRKTMNGYYQAALDFVEKQAKIGEKK